MINNIQLSFLLGMIFGGLSVIAGYKYKEWKLKKQFVNQNLDGKEKAE